jgi:hypothetical protein
MFIISKDLLIKLYFLFFPKCIYIYSDFILFYLIAKKEHENKVNKQIRKENYFTKQINNHKCFYKYKCKHDECRKI